jgi:hypothetical protein
LEGPKWPVRGYFFARKALQPIAHRRSNAPMQAGDFARTANPATRGKLMNQELIPKLGFNMNTAGKFSHVLSCSAE